MADKHKLNRRKMRQNRASDNGNMKETHTFLDFFAGSGLVTLALKPYFIPSWANDICKKKAAVYFANHRDIDFRLGPIEDIHGSEVPSASLSWASFPCQDLSLAGNMKGIESTRSGLVWHWIRIMDEMREMPPIVVAENVVGLISAEKGEHYKQLHSALQKRGYRVGAVVLDARRWVPQSRPRVFVIGVLSRLDISDYIGENPIWCHTPAIRKIAHDLEQWVWWKMPLPPTSEQMLEDMVDFNAPCDPPEKREKILGLIPDYHWRRVEEKSASGIRVFPGYKRIRNGKQVLELRFDGLAGCIRTPNGGSSRQILVLRYNNRFETRLLTIAETAGLMGAGNKYHIVGSYNDGYKAMGDAVAVPAVRYLAQHLLSPLARQIDIAGITK